MVAVMVVELVGWMAVMKDELMVVWMVDHSADAMVDLMVEMMVDM